MADRRSSADCNSTCGCQYPCPGGNACRCENTTGGAGETNMEHNRCSCGDHCGCNPCECTKTTGGAGKTHCKCGEGCTCVTCAS